MADNSLKTAQQFIQDVIAPDVREIKVGLKALREHVDLRFDAVLAEIRSLREITSITERMSILEIKQNLSERLAVLEANQQKPQ